MHDERRTTADQWYRAIVRTPNPALRLICFPHLGGTAAFFMSWARAVPPGVEVLAARYPGREERLLETSAETMDELAGPIADECAKLPRAPLAFFGHSMGASVAYEVACRLQERYGITLPALFVSACAAPGHETPDDLADASDAELIAEMTSLGGTASEVFQHPELLELVLPAVRADYRLIENHMRDRDLPAARARLRTPIVAYYGDQDPDVGAEAVDAWKDFTTAGFTVRVFDGDHFYLVGREPVLMRDIVRHASARH